MLQPGAASRIHEAHLLKFCPFRRVGEEEGFFDSLQGALDGGRVVEIADDELDSV
jgi:hypothetical protein